MFHQRAVGVCIDASSTEAKQDFDGEVMSDDEYRKIVGMITLLDGHNVAINNGISEPYVPMGRVISILKLCREMETVDQDEMDERAMTYRVGRGMTEDD